MLIIEGLLQLFKAQMLNLLNLVRDKIFLPDVPQIVMELSCQKLQLWPDTCVPEQLRIR